MNQLKAQRDEVGREIREFETQINQANGELNEYRNKRTNFQQKIAQIETLRSIEECHFISHVTYFEWHCCIQSSFGERAFH